MTVRPRSRPLRASTAGFTLVELMIVLIILGILAALAIPQLQASTAESREALVLSNLQRIRQAIEVYRVQHNDTYPTTDIVTQLMGQTNKAGDAGTTYGPYLQGDFPANPLKGRNDIQVLNTMYHEAYGLQGWMYAQQTGEIRLNSPGLGPSGVAYFEM